MVKTSVAPIVVQICLLLWSRDRRHPDQMTAELGIRDGVALGARLEGGHALIGEGLAHGGLSVG